LQPIVRLWGRWRHRNAARRSLESNGNLPPAVRQAERGVVVVPEDRPRSELAATLVEALRCRGIRAMTPSGWEDYDARLLLSGLVYGELQTSSHPEGFVQVRIRPRPRRRRLVGGTVVVGAGAVAVNPLFAVLFIPVAASVARGAARARVLPTRVFREPSTS
jgi:hypothetical protein